MRKTMIILKGVSGCGKFTLSKELDQRHGGAFFPRMTLRYR